MKKATRWISILAALLLGASSQADMITVGGDQTAGTGTLTVNQDLTFTLTAAFNGPVMFVFDEVVISDGGQTYAYISGLEYSINGTRHSIGRWMDNFAANIGTVTDNDGWLLTDSQTFSIGDTIVLHAGTATTYAGGGSAFNPWSSGDYDVYMMSNSGGLMSDAVPEPATAGLLGIAALALYGIRRIKNFNRPV